MKLKKRNALIALAAWLAVVIGVFAFTMLSNESDTASPTGPDPKVSRSTVPRTTQRQDGTTVVVESAPEGEPEVLGEVQIPLTGFSLFKTDPRAFTPAPFVLPEFFAAYVGPGFVVTTPDAPGPGPTPTVPRPMDPPTTTTPPTTRPPTTTVPPTTAPPPPPTTAPPPPPTTAPPPPPTTAPPPPPTTAPPPPPTTAPPPPPTTHRPPPPPSP